MFISYKRFIYINHRHLWDFVKILSQSKDKGDSSKESVVNFLKKKLQVLARSKEFIVIFHDTNHYLESYCNQCSTFYECFRILKRGDIKNNVSYANHFTMQS